MNEAELYNNRIERRFLVPSGVIVRTDKLLPQFGEYQHTVDGIHLPVTRNVYFGRNGEVGTTGLLRTRQYVAELSDDFLEIQPGEPCIVETKLKGNNTSVKTGITGNYEEALAMFSDPENLLDLLKSGASQEYSAALRKLLLEFDFLPLIPQLGMVYRRRHLHPVDQGVNCRITIDGDLSYYAFGEDNPNHGIQIGREGLTKLEVKYLDSEEDFVRPLLESLREKGAIPITTLQHKAIALLRESQKLLFPASTKRKLHPAIESDPMHSLRFANLVNEVPGTEIELKLNVEPQLPLKLIRLIRDRFSSTQTEPFSTLPGQTEISYWRYFLDIYGYMDEEEMKQAFVVVRHPDKSKFMVQEKGPARINPDLESGILNRTEEKFRVERTYTLADLDVIKAMFEEKLKRDIHLVASNRRTKYYLFVKNDNSGRYYNIAVDLSEGNDANLVQVEVEYKGKVTDVSTRAPGEEVTAELNELADTIKQTPGFILTPTTLTKFQWFLNSQRKA